MSIQELDTRGMKCPQPTLKLTVVAMKMKSGDILDVIADCPTFERDLRSWCDRSRKTLLWIKEERDARRCQIQF